MNKNQHGFGSTQIVMIVAAIGVIGGVGWYVLKGGDGKGVQVSNTSETAQSTTTQTQTSNASLQNEKLTTKTTDTVQDINALIVKGDYLKLQPYMADSVAITKQSANATAILSKADADSIINEYLAKTDVSNGAQLPWDFEGQDVTRSTINRSRGAISGFTTQGHIGISHDNAVIAYKLDANQKIDAVYMSYSASLIE